MLELTLNSLEINPDHLAKRGVLSNWSKHSNRLSLSWDSAKGCQDILYISCILSNVLLPWWFSPSSSRSSPATSLSYGVQFWIREGYPQKILCLLVDTRQVDLPWSLLRIKIARSHNCPLLKTSFSKAGKPFSGAAAGRFLLSWGTYSRLSTVWRKMCRQIGYYQAKDQCKRPWDWGFCLGDWVNETCQNRWKHQNFFRCDDTLSNSIERITSFLRSPLDESVNIGRWVLLLITKSLGLNVAGSNHLTSDDPSIDVILLPVSPENDDVD